MLAYFVKPYVKGDKNDYNDAEGVCEAAGRPNMRFVTVKTGENGLTERFRGWLAEPSQRRDAVMRRSDAMFAVPHRSF